MKPVLLCIDDETNGLLLRQMVLESNGYEVLTANRGSEGLNLFNSRHVDLVLLDYAMPEMNGHEVAMRMKGAKPQVPILMLSAYLPLPDGVQEFIDAFVTKGESPERLVDRIAQMLSSVSNPRKAA